MRKEQDMRWKVLNSKPIINRPWLSARQDKVLLPNGNVYDEYYVLHYPTWINVIAITNKGKMIMERQYRHALGIVSTEIVAGVVEDGETPLQGAQRELKEETGYSGGQWKEIMTISPNPSTMDNLCHCFLAKGVEKTDETHWDATEDLDIMLMEPSQVKQMLIDGKLIQALMIAPLWRYFTLEL